jgi:hypothetical protein
VSIGHGHVFVLVPDEGEPEYLGTYSLVDRPATVLAHITDDRETAAEWVETLHRGELPDTGDGDPVEYRVVGQVPNP